MSNWLTYCLGHGALSINTSALRSVVVTFKHNPLSDYSGPVTFQNEDFLNIVNNMLELKNVQIVVHIDNIYKYIAHTNPRDINGIICSDSQHYGATFAEAVKRACLALERKHIFDPFPHNG
jgi:protein involved in ribonucleotide reduction